MISLSFDRNHKVSYDLPSLFSKRATSIGFGRRTVMEKSRKGTSSPELSKYIDGVPGPGSVDLRGAFDQGSPRVKAFSFGLSREHFNKVYIKENPVADVSVPGPGQYKIPHIVGREGQNVSIKGRNRHEKSKEISE